ncbi:MAG: DUF2851 family protein [Bacteroidales bacterium]|nr:DUF2851 family protein [Bacteroidales bacterium]
MTEEFLQYIWKHALYDPSSLLADNKEEVEVLRPGEQNFNAGPDFLNARLRIGNTTWAGNVEIHISSSDWFKHNHHYNKAYNNVILQAVYQNDRTVKLQNGGHVPTIELKFDNRLYGNYRDLVDSNSRIPCQDRLKLIDPFIIGDIINRMTIERLEEKSDDIARTLKNTGNDWAETFYIHLAKNFGFKINAVPFEMLARSLPFRYIARHKDNLLQIEALLFGQAGFLDNRSDDEYYHLLVREYRLLRSKFDLKPLEKHLWKFLRLRPCNFPTIRLAQFARLLSGTSSLFAVIIETGELKQLKKHFHLTASEYWDSHYNFNRESDSLMKKSLGMLSFNNIVINTIVPVLFLYGDRNIKNELKERALNFLTEVPSEDNHIIRNWKRTGIAPKNAFESQGLLQLRNKYCRIRKCLNCRIGNKIITIPNKE